MAVGALTAAVCVWEEMQHRGGLVAILLGALVAWGLYGAYHHFSALKWRHDEYERRLRASGETP